MTTRPDHLTVVVPVFNECEMLARFFERTSAALSSLEGCQWDLIFVDDGSRDDSLEILTEFASAHPHVQVVKLSRNFGHQAAICAGLDQARGDCVVTMDADLQDPPEVIEQLVRRWREGHDVVYAIREDRSSDGAGKRLTAKLFYWTMQRVSGVDIPREAGDFRLMSRRAVDTLNRLPEKSRFLRGMVAWIGYPQVGVPYRREARQEGTTKFTYGKMVRFAVDGITSFSSLPLRLSTWLGYGASVLAFLYLASVFVQKAQGHTVQGWATIMVAMLFLGGVQLICVGIMGEYIGRIFSEVKARPMYVVEDVVGGELESGRRASG